MFIPHKTDDGRIPTVEYLPAGAITPKLGLALTQTAGGLAQTQTAGNLTVAGGTTKPTYICMTEKSTAVAAGTVIPVQRVSSDLIYETVSSEAFTSIKQGNKVTIATDGLRVTATTTDGVAEVVAVEDTAAGGKVYVRF